MSAESFCCPWCGDQLMHHTHAEEQHCKRQAEAWALIESEGRA